IPDGSAPWTASLPRSAGLTTSSARFAFPKGQRRSSSASSPTRCASDGISVLARLDLSSRCWCSQCQWRCSDADAFNRTPLLALRAGNVEVRRAPLIDPVCPPDAAVAGVLPGPGAPPGLGAVLRPLRPAGRTRPGQALPRALLPGDGGAAALAAVPL